MRDESDAFWKEFLAKGAQAETTPELTMEEAEERMKTGGEIPFTQAELDDIVRSVTGEEVPADNHTSDPSPVAPKSPSSDMRDKTHDETEDETDAFWQDLLTKVALADTRPLTMEEAEERMKSAGEAPLSEEQIDSIVHSATAEETQRGLRVLQGSAPARERAGFLTRYRGGLTKVAALFLGMLLLYSVTSEALVSPPAHGPDPEFGTAATLLLDPLTDGETRVRIHRQLFDLAMSGIQTLKQVAGETGELQSDAERLLSELRGAFQSDEVPTLSLEEVPPGPPPSTVEKRAWLSALTDQTRNAILVLRNAQVEQEDSSLSAGRKIALEVLAKELEY